MFLCAVVATSLFAVGVFAPSSDNTTSTEGTSPPPDAVTGKTSPSPNESVSAPPTPLNRTQLAIDSDGTLLLARSGSCADGQEATVQVITPDKETITMPDPPAEVVRVHAQHGTFMVWSRQQLRDQHLHQRRRQRVDYAGLPTGELVDVRARWAKLHP